MFNLGFKKWKKKIISLKIYIQVRLEMVKIHPAVLQVFTSLFVQRFGQ